MFLIWFLVGWLLGVTSKQLGGAANLIGQVVLERRNGYFSLCCISEFPSFCLGEAEILQAPGAYMFSPMSQSLDGWVGADFRLGKQCGRN